MNPFVIQDLYIITTDLSNTKSNEIFTTAVNIKAQKDIEKLINDKDVILEFTKFDLINRIFGINDLNDGNYGILYKGDKKFVKIIDFRSPSTSIPLQEIVFSLFVKAYGDFYQKNGLAKIILSNRQEKQKYIEGFEVLKSIGNENLKKILISVQKEILDFISLKDEVNNLEVKEQIGLNNEAIDNLDIYVKTIQNNFEFALNYLKKRLSN